MLLDKVIRDGVRGGWLHAVRMGTNIFVTPLYGALCDGPVCSLLEVWALLQDALCRCAKLSVALSLDTFQACRLSLSLKMLCLCRQVNSFRLLLDCGWDDAYDPALLAPLLPQLPALDGVLISHPDPAHLGALPYLARSSLSVSSLQGRCSRAFRRRCPK